MATATRPVIDVAGIPEGLRRLRRWILWRFIVRDGKRTKIPCGPDGRPIPWTDPARWLDFDEAVRAYRNNPELAGVGIVLGDGLVGFDSDDSVADDGTIDPETVAILGRLGTYAEVSPSGRGIKAFGLGPEVLPDGKRGRNDPGDRFEFYTSGRWFAVTGWRLPDGPEDVAECGDAFSKAYQELYPSEAPERRVKPLNGHRPTGNGSADRYALTALAEEVARVASAPEGSRNDVLNRASYNAGQLVGAGLLGRQQVIDALLDAAERAGLGRMESERTIASGLSAGIAEPRDLANVRALQRPEAPRPAPSANGSSGHHNGKPSAPVTEAPEERPEVVISTEEHEVIDRFVATLKREPTVYQRGSMLVRVCRDTVKDRGFRRPPNAPRITPVPPARLREILTRRARIVKQRRDRDGNVSLVPTHPPEWGVAGLLARGEWPGVRHLEGVIESPTIRPDGSTLDAPGWDEATGLLFDPNGDFDPIPSAPTLDDARAAAGRLLAIVADFPFAGDEHKAAWLAGLLTALARYAIDGPTPLFLFDANTPGTGKSLLCHLVSLIAARRPMACADMPEREEEMSKTLLAIALAGDPFVLFDNVPTGFSIGGASLDRALTAPTVKGRILGRSEMTAELPWNAIVFASGNNIGLRGDALRRVIPCRLEAQEERPEERDGFAIPDIIGHVQERRGALVADCLTVLRAHALAGRPDPGLTPMDYPAWCRIVRNAVHWSTGLDPAGPRKEARANDPETQGAAALVAGWARLCAASGRSDGLTAKEARDGLEQHRDQHPELHELLCEWSKDGALPSARTIGNRLNKLRGRFTASGALDFAIRDGNRRWFVKPPKRTIVSGSSDSSGSISRASRENCEDICKTNITPYGPRESHLESLEPLRADFEEEEF